MLDLPFLLDKCEDCGSKWRTGDRDRSNRCPVCGSANVSFGKPRVLVAGAGLGGALLAVIVMAQSQHTHPAAVNVAASPSPSAYQAPIATGAPGTATVREDPKLPAPASRSNTPAEPGANATPKQSEDGDAITDPSPGLSCNGLTTDAARRACEASATPKTEDDLQNPNDGARPDRAQRRRILAEQEQWRRKAQEACSGDESCMINAYRERAEQLINERE